MMILRWNNSLRLKLSGLAAAGCNAVNRMIEANLQGVEFIAVNTDAQALYLANASVKLQIEQS